MVKIIGACAFITVGMFTYVILLGLWVAQGHADASYQLKWELATLVAMLITMTLAISESVGAARIIDQQAAIINLYDELAGEQLSAKVAAELEARGILEGEIAEA